MSGGYANHLCGSPLDAQGRHKVAAAAAKQAAILAALEARTERLRIATEALRQVVLLLEVNGGGRGYQVRSTALDALTVARAALDELGVRA